VNGVTEVLRVSDEIIEPLPQMVNNANLVFLKGIMRFKNRLIILLEPGKVFNLEEQLSFHSLNAVGRK